MKKILYFALLFVFGLSTVYGDCTDSDLEMYKEEASNIKVSYKVDNDATDAFDAPIYDAYIVTVKNLYENYYIEDGKSGVKIGKDYSENDEINGDNTYINYDLISGVNKLKVYHNGCDTVVRTITLKLPVYNNYYEDPLCNNVDKNKTKVCNKWLEKSITYENFYSEVSKYKIDNTNKDFKSGMLNFFKNNYLTIIISLLIFVVIITLTSIIKKKRSVV